MVALAVCHVCLSFNHEHTAMVSELSDLSELPTDAVEHLSGASDGEVEEFMDRQQLEPVEFLGEQEATSPKGRALREVEQDLRKADQEFADAGSQLGENEEKTGRLAESAEGEEDPLEFLPEGGRIINESHLKLIPKDPDATIHFTMDGSDPTEKSPKYDPMAPIMMEGKHAEQVQVKAIAITKGKASAVMKADFKIEGTLGVQAHEQREKAEALSADAAKESIAASKLAAEAVKKEEKAHVISHEAMKLVTHKEDGESKLVKGLQEKARAAKSDFFTAVDNNKEKKDLEIKLSGEKKTADGKYWKSMEEMLAAGEDFQTADMATRTVSWVGWIQKDRAQGVHARAKDDKTITEDRMRYSKAKLKESTDRQSYIAGIAKTRKAEYEAAARSAEEADEDNFFSSALKEAEEREKRANEAKAVADADKKEKESAAAAAKAAAAVKAAGDDADQAIAEAKEAVTEAQNAAKKAGQVAEAALVEARAAKKAADAARAKMAARGKAAEAGLAAVNAENHARAKVHTLDNEAHTLKASALEYRQTAEEKKLKMIGDKAVLDRANAAQVQTTKYHKTTDDERKAAQKALDDLQARIKALKEEWTAAKQAEEDAIAALPIAKGDMDKTTKASKETDLALKKVIEARRKAWKSAYKSESANRMLKEAAEKVARIAAEEKAMADAKIAKAKKAEDDAKAVLAEKQKLYEEAKALIAQAKASNDVDAEATAERAAEAAKSAAAASKAAVGASETSGNAIRASCQKNLALAEKLNKSVMDMGDANDSVGKAKKLGDNTNSMMKLAKAAAKKAHVLMKESIEEHSFRAEDLIEKTQNRQRLDKLIADALVDEQRKMRYLARAESIEKDWKGKLLEVTEYAGTMKKQYDATAADYNAASSEAKTKEAAYKAVGDKEAAAKKSVAEGEKSVAEMAATAGKDLTAKLMSIRSKWAGVAEKDAKLRNELWKTAVENALPAVMQSTQAEAASSRVYQKLAAEQDGGEATAVATRKQMKIIWVQKQQNEAKLKKAMESLGEQLKTTQREQKKWQKELERLEKLRRETALEALTLRVESIWKKRAKVHDPLNKRRLEKSVFNKIVAAWDRDGTPLGPGVMDTWYLDTRKITYAHNNSPGYLSEKVISRCSSACSEYADLQCAQGHVSRSCTRGRVYRVRFVRTGTIDAANDWFVCRCNSGVMQFAAQEKLAVTREKNKLIRAVVAPNDLTFDVRLHAEEMLPDNYVHCFRDFENWLTKKTDFSKPIRAKFDALDALALSPPEEAEAAYKTVKSLWLEQCIKEQPAPPPPPKTYPGSTDGSLDIFDLKSQPYTTLNVRQHRDRKTPAEKAKGGLEEDL